MITHQRNTHPAHPLRYVKQWVSHDARLIMTGILAEVISSAKRVGGEANALTGCISDEAIDRTGRKLMSGKE